MTAYVIKFLFVVLNLKTLIIMFACCRWPLVMDESGQAATFLKYRDVNFLLAVGQGNMDPEIIRKALIGAVR